MYVVNKVLPLFSSPGVGLIKKFKGDWAVVTGATGAIGQCYAEQLAAKGMNVVLVGRREEALNDVARSVGNKFNVQTKVVKLDGATATVADYEAIAKQLSGIAVSVLVNNAGASYDFPEFLTSVDPATLSQIITLNCNSVVQLTRALLPAMAERKKGVVINVGSISGLFPTPLLAVYSASKAFVDVFSASLAAEYKNKGIVVQSCTPFFVVSSMSKIRRSSLFVPKPDAFVKNAVASIGNGAVRSVPYLPHFLQYAMMAMLPEKFLLAHMLKVNAGTRKRAVAKAQKAKEGQ